jgi:predicted dehydrogenase
MAHTRFDLERSRAFYRLAAPRSSGGLDTPTREALRCGKGSERSKRIEEDMPDRVRIGVVGCGLIAQVMHLHYLNELSDRFELAAVCDISPGLAAGCAERFGVHRAHADWEALLDDRLDAAMILTSGDHAPIALAAAQAGVHVFVEKPMALSSRSAEEVVRAADNAGVRLMVGMMKRYDPAYERLAALLPTVDDVRLVRVTTLESPLEPYVAHYPMIKAGRPPDALLDELRLAEEREIDLALPGAAEETRWCYRWILLDNLVHELNVLRGVLGEPTEIRSADLSSRCASVCLRFGEVDCHLSWVDLPGIARYKQEFAFYAPDQRLTLELPSPFLRSMPSKLTLEGGVAGSSDSFKQEEIVSFEEAFKRELVEFADCATSGRPPRTPGSDGLADLRLCEAIARAHQARLTERLAAEVGVGGPA